MHHTRFCRHHQDQSCNRLYMHIRFWSSLIRRDIAIHGYGPDMVQRRHYSGTMIPWSFSLQQGATWRLQMPWSAYRQLQSNVLCHIVCSSAIQIPELSRQGIDHDQARRHWGCRHFLEALRKYLQNCTVLKKLNSIVNDVSLAFSKYKAETHYLFLTSSWFPILRVGEV